MRILVIGRSGQLAQSLLREAAGSAIEITALGRPDIELGDIGSLRAAIAAHRPEVVVNAAAYTAVDKAEAEPAAAFAVNAEGAATVARATAAAQVPLVHVSTDYVFDGAKPSAYFETDATGPIGAYGASKLEGERQVANLNARYIIVRTAWVVSPFGSNFCKTMLRLAAERSELRVVADQIGSPTYAIDFASALLTIAGQVKAMGADDRRWGVYHLANAGTTSWAGLAEATLAASAQFGGRVVPVRPITTEEYPTSARRPLNSRLDCTRIKQVFGVAMPPWQDAVRRCVGELMTPRG